MGARALALRAASCFVNRRDRMAGLLQDDRAGAPPGALAAGPDVDDGMPTAPQYVAWPRGWLRGWWGCGGGGLCPIRIGLGAALVRCKRGQIGGLAPALPGTPIRRAGALPVHQGADRAGLCATVGHFPNPPFVGVGEWPGPPPR